jgi:hypothetical protein
VSSRLRGCAEGAIRDRDRRVTAKAVDSTLPLWRN